MNAAIILATALVAQCPTVVVEYQYPVVLPATIPVYSSPVIREKIYFYEVERTRFYAEASLPNGSHITVPIINGYSPRVTISQCQDGSTLREYFYDEQIVYKGGIINYQNQNSARLPAAPKRIAMPSPHTAPDTDCKANIERLERMIQELQRNKVQAGVAPVRTQAPSPVVEAPVKTPEQVPDTLYMKRPSEFDQ